MKKTAQQGFYLVEIIISAAIISVVSLFLFAAYTLYVNIALSNTEKIQASFLAEETIEALKSIRDADWNAISSLELDTPYYISFAGSVWQTSTEMVPYIDGVFERSFVVGSVLRNDVTKDISESGSLDDNTRKITATVSWIGINKATTSLAISTYITNLHE